MHSGLVNIYFKTFSYVSYAHGTKSYTINHILCTYQLFGPLIQCRGTKNYELRNRSVHFHNIELKPLQNMIFWVLSFGGKIVIALVILDFEFL